MALGGAETTSDAIGRSAGELNSRRGGRPTNWTQTAATMLLLLLQAGLDFLGIISESGSGGGSMSARSDHGSRCPAGQAALQRRRHLVSGDLASLLSPPPGDFNFCFLFARVGRRAHAQASKLFP